ncbi:MAG: hypothetical protein HYU27_02025 [Acidobacteria bacterium]|nr:hypothetical protein [Acidobacteriota bacterium]
MGSTLIETSELKTIRSILLGTIVFTLIGMGFELVFLGHVEGVAQLLPLALIAAALLLLGWYAAARTGSGIRSFQVVMALFIGGGILGIVLHVRSNMEFARDMYPNIERMELFRKTVAGALPALAPGSMIAIGLIGLAYTFRHPALQRRTK